MGVEWRDKEFENLPIGKGRVLREGNDVAILALGKPCASALEAAVAAEREGVSVAVYDLRYAKPLDSELIIEVGKQFERIITVEDGLLRGGVGEAIIKLLSDNNIHKSIKNLGIADTFIEQGTPAELYSLCGYDTEGILRAIIEKN